MRVELRHMVAAGLGLGGPVAWGVASGRPALGALAAIGALAVSGLSTESGLRRLLGHGAAAVAGTAVAGLAGVVIAGRGWLTAVTVVLIAGLLAVAGGISRPMAEHTTRFIVFMVISTGVAKGVEPVAAAVLFAGGAVWGLLVAALCLHARKGPADPAAAEPGDADPAAAERGDAERGDAERGDAERGDAERGDAERGDVERGDAGPEGVARPAPSAGALLRRWWRTLGSASGWQYPIRLTACLAAAEVAGLLWPQPAASWIAVTVVIVVRRRLDGAVRRSVERAAGTAAGVAAGSAALLWVPPSWLFVLLVAALAAIRPVLKERNHTLYATVMTPLVLLLMEGGARVPPATIGYRVADTVIGCVLALGLGYLPWVVRRERSVRAVVG
ncbi:FUSC family protein [Nonomuraea sp. JJY05]|uniref:FUSC family protein n=1 Tax=Nonomuraea sp. JJY05 TaxID=3350255 RepID=UPI00373F1548